MGQRSELEIHLLSLENGGKAEMDGGHFRGGTAAIPQHVVVRSLGEPWWNVTQGNHEETDRTGETDWVIDL